MADDGTTKASIVLSAEDKTGPAFQSARRNMAALAADAKRTAYQQQQLAFQLNDLFVQISSGQSPLTAIIQQGSQLSGTFGGAGGAIKAVLALLTPARLLFGGLAAGIGAVGLAFYEGAKQSKAFNDAVTLSGNFAGQTAGKFDANAKTIAAQSAGSVSVSEAKDAGEALIRTGTVGPQVFAAATQAAARYSKATGQTAAEVAKDFAGMADDATKWAIEHNRALNFITSAQLLQIKAFQDAGREVDAQKIIYDALNERLRGLDSNLGTLDRTLNTLTGAWSSFWEAAKGVGKAETVEDRIAQAQRALDASRARRDAAPGIGAADLGAFSGKPVLNQGVGSTDIAEENLRLLKREQAAGQQAALDKAAADQDQKAAIAAHQRLDLLLDQTKGATALSKALKENARDFAAAEKAGTPFTDAQKKAITTETTRKFTDPVDKSLNKASLDDRLKALRDELAQEQDALKFHNDYLRGLYQDGEISLRTFYDEQRKITADGVQKRLAELAGERAAVQAALAKSTDPVDKVKLKTQSKDIDSEISKVRQRASEDVVLANQEEARSFKALQESISSFQEQLLAASGDPLGAEMKRLESTMARIKVLAKQSQANPSGTQISDGEVDALREQLTVRAQLNEQQRAFGLLTAQSANAEDRLLLQAKESGKGLLETEDELHALREKSLVQLGDLIERVRALAAVSKDPADLQHLDDLILKYQQLQAAVDPRKLRLDAAADNIGDALAGGLERAGEAGVKLSDILRDIGSQIGRIVLREIAIKPAAEGISNFIKGAGGQGAGQNLIGLISGLGVKTKAPDVGVGLGTGELTSTQRAQLFDHDTSPASSAAAASAPATTVPAAVDAQIVALDKATTALQALADAANSASGALGKPTPAGTPAAPAAEASAAPGDAGGTASLTSAQRGQLFDHSADPASADTGKAIEDLGKTASTGSDALGGAVGQLVLNATRASGAFGAIPGPIGQVVNFLMTLATSKAGASIGSSFGSFFGGSSSSSSGGTGFGTGSNFGNQDYGAFFHEGGVVGRTSDMRSVPAGIFDDATRLHGGGIVRTGRRKPELAPNERATVLRAGEEAITPQDPRHTDNGGAAVLRAMANGGALVATAGSAPQIHAPGLMVRRQATPTQGLARDEVPAILRVGTEVLKGSDPRHSDNLPSGGRADVLNGARWHDAVLKGQGPLPATALAGAARSDTPAARTEAAIASAALRMADVVSGKHDRAGDPMWPWEDATRYHTGGKAGHAPDEVSAILKREEEILSTQDPRHRDNGGLDRYSKREPSFVVQVTAAPGMSRDTAYQQGVQIGQGTQHVLRRNGGGR